MATVVTKVIIFTLNEGYFIYEISSDEPSSAAKTAIMNYIKAKLGYEDKFALSESTWGNIMTAISTSLDVEKLVELVNGLCATNDAKIVGVISGYNEHYSLPEVLSK